MPGPQTLGPSEQSAAPQAAPEPAKGSFFSFICSGGFGSLIRSTTLVLLAGVLITFFWIAPAIRLPFWPFETTGRIFVESPEVYTRERLVNDRYDQDFWLHTQLIELDKSVSLFAQKRSEMLDVWYGTRTEAALSSPSELPAPPFEKEFELRSSMRDRIRQLILENLLDDRHDLTGNTLYGLKFDTTVIPGKNTHRRAFVRISVEIDPVPSLERVTEFFKYRLDEIEGDPENIFHHLPQHFRRWMNNVESRLNSFILELPRQFCDPVTGDRFSAEEDHAGRGEDESLNPVLLALSKILHVDSRRVPPPDLKALSQIRLPEPWNEYFFINVEPNHECYGKPRLVLEPVFDSVIVAEEDRLTEFRKTQGFSSNYFYVAQLVVQSDDDRETPEGGKKYAIMVDNYLNKPTLTLEEYEAMKLKTDINVKSLNYLLEREKDNIDICLNNDKHKCFGKRYFIASGLVNFTKKLSQSDAYSYAVFPRQDVTGMMAETAVRSAIQSSRDGGGPSIGGALASQIQQEARTISRVVNFADGTDTEGKDGIDFGWVTADPDIIEPAQFSQLVLVSVPAYVDHLILRVTTGWLDRHSQELPQGNVQPMTIRLPPDYEAFDTVVREGDERYGPAIYKTFMDPPIVVRACESADILIPGARLWRSTTVSLGGQPAKKITVLPNMRGIIASFRPVNLPSVGGTGLSDKEGPVDTPLMVWTSEGVDSVRGKVGVLAPESGTCPKVDARE